jgi:hypothetical protein
VFTNGQISYTKIVHFFFFSQIFTPPLFLHLSLFLGDFFLTL